MAGVGVRERLEEYFAVAGIDADAPWLRPPASRAAVEATASAVGADLPDDLVELLTFHNGRQVLNGYDWLPCTQSPEYGLAEQTTFIRFLIEGELTDTGALANVPGPGPNVLQVGYVSGMCGYLYDVDDHVGRIHMLDTSARPPIIPLAVSLTHLIDVHVALARAGHILVDPEFGPDWRAPSAEIGALLLEHGMPDVQIDVQSWVMRPESQSFEIFDPSS